MMTAKEFQLLNIAMQVCEDLGLTYYANDTTIYICRSGKILATLENTSELIGWSKCYQVHVRKAK